MKVIAKLSFVGLFMLVFACNAKDEDIVPRQRNNIVGFLDRAGLEYDIRDGVYRHVGNADRVGYGDAMIAEKGDEVDFFYEAYVFSTQGRHQLFYTNKKWLIDEIAANERYGFNAGSWSDEAKKVVLGQTPMVEGLKRGIPGSRQGDSLVLFMASDLGYGDKHMSAVGGNSPLMFVINIDSVTKQ